MAFEGSQLRVTGLTASADLSAKQYFFVKISGAKTVTVCAATTDKPIGVLQNAPLSGQPAEICAVGETKLSGSAALTAGNSVGTEGAGQAAAYTATDTTKYIVGQVLVGTAAANGLAVAFIDCPGARTLA